MNNVFVYIELENGVPADVSLELTKAAVSWPRRSA